MIRFASLLIATLLVANELPYWIINFTNGAVGSGTTERIATLNAKAELARQKNLKIQSQTNKNNGVFTSQSTHKSNQKIGLIIIKERFVADNGTVYVWVVEEPKPNIQN